MKHAKSPLPSAGVSISFLQTIKTPAIFVPVVIAFVLLLSSLSDGLQRDDFMHRALLLGHNVIPGYTAQLANPVDAANGLFSFRTGNSNLLQEAQKYGNAPWWADDDLMVNFWRPVVALTHWLDYQLWPQSPALMRLHSLFWNALIGLLFGFWLVRLGLKGLSLWLVMFLYALDASHVHAVTWLANRNILLATTFGLISLIALQRWDQKQAINTAGIALLAYILCLLSAEAGLSFIGFTGAYLLILSSAPWKKRLVLFAGFIAVTVAWRLLYSAQGYGAVNSGFYLDPINDFSSFFVSLLINGPIMLYEQLVRVPSLSMTMSSALEIIQVIISMVVLLITLGFCIPLLKRNRLAVFGIVAAIIAVAPACATTVTGGRLAFVFGLGICLSVGLWYTALLQRHDWFATSNKIFQGASYVWAGALFIAVVSGTGYIWYSKVASSITVDKPKFNAYTNVLENLEADQVLVLLNPPLVFELMYLPLKADYYGLNAPKSMISVVPGLTDLQVTKTAENKIQVTNEGGFLIASSAQWYQKDLPQNGWPFLLKRVDRFFVSNQKQVDYNKTYSLNDADITVESTVENRDPNQLTVTFDQPLNSGRYLFLAWDWDTNQYVSVSVADFDKGMNLKGPF